MWIFGRILKMHESHAWEHLPGASSIESNKSLSYAWREGLKELHLIVNQRKKKN